MSRHRRRSWRLAGWLAAASVAAAGVAGYAAQSGELVPPPAPRVAPTVSATSPSTSTAESFDGYEVRIDRIGVRSDLITLGLQPDRTVQVPPLSAVEQAGWYRHGPKPGEPGPAVILGHVNGQGRAGVFARLAELRAGDVIDVARPSGTVRFRVYETTVFPKEEFPTARIYGRTNAPELRLITCGGDLDATGRNYRSQVVAFARAER